jgi:hypothetical protein
MCHTCRIVEKNASWETGSRSVLSFPWVWGKVLERQPFRGVRMVNHRGARLNPASQGRLSRYLTGLEITQCVRRG